MKKATKKVAKKKSSHLDFIDTLQDIAASLHRIETVQQNIHHELKSGVSYLESIVVVKRVMGPAASNAGYNLEWTLEHSTTPFPIAIDRAFAPLPCETFGGKVLLPQEVTNEGEPTPPQTTPHPPWKKP